MRQLLGTVLFLLVFHSGARAEPWSLVKCDPAQEGRFAAFEKAVRSARPGGELYLPKPFPQTDDDAALDYLYQYRSFHRERMSLQSLPANEKAVLSAVVGGQPRISISRVANWTPLRCRGEKRREFYFLLRVSDRATGKEVSRAALDASGLISVLVNATDAELAEPASGDARRLPDVETVARRVRDRHGLAVTAPQYVATFGTRACPVTRPCLAFRGPKGDGGLYLFEPQKEELVRFDENAKRLIDGVDLGTDALNRSLQESLRPDEALVSLGGKEWVRAHRVPPGANR